MSQVGKHIIKYDAEYCYKKESNSVFFDGFFGVHFFEKLISNINNVTDGSFSNTVSAGGIINNLAIEDHSGRSTAIQVVGGLTTISLHD